MGAPRGRGVKGPPPERHPIDVRADEIRRAAEPRQATADALDHVLGEWYMGGLSTPPVTVADWCATLFRACIEAEPRAVQFDRTPRVEGWDP